LVLISIARCRSCGSSGGPGRRGRTWADWRVSNCGASLLKTFSRFQITASRRMSNRSWNFTPRAQLERPQGLVGFVRLPLCRQAGDHLSRPIRNVELPGDQRIVEGEAGILVGVGAAVRLAGGERDVSSVCRSARPFPGPGRRAARRVAGVAARTRRRGTSWSSPDTGVSALRMRLPARTARLSVQCCRCRNVIQTCHARASSRTASRTRRPQRPRHAGIGGGGCPTQHVERQKPAAD